MGIQRHFRQIAILAIFPITSFAANENSIGIGVQDKSTGDEISVSCVEWSVDRSVCNSVQFMLLKNNQLTPIGPKLNSEAAATLGHSSPAPASNDKGASIAPANAFEVTKLAYGGGSDGGTIIGSLSGGSAGLVLLAGGFAALGQTVQGIGGTPFLSPATLQTVPTIDVSPEQVSTNISYTRNVSETVSGQPGWSDFWNQAPNETPEQRAASFSNLYATGVSGLVTANSIPANYYLVRIEYSAVNSTYSFVFIPSNMTSQYAHDLSVQESQAQQKYNTEQAQINAVTARNAWATHIAKQRQKLYFGIGLGIPVAILLSPVVVDLIRDVVMYPAESIRYDLEKKRNGKRSKKLAEEWKLAWSALLIDKNADQPLTVSTKIFSAIQTTLQATK